MAVAREVRDDAGGADGRASRALPVELRPVAGFLPDGLLAAAARRARALGVDADAVLVCAGLVDRETYCRLAAAHFGVAVADETPAVADTDLPAPDIRALGTGIVAIDRDDTGLIVGVAARGDTLQGLSRALATTPDLRDRVRLMTPAALRAHVLRRAGRALASEAVSGLARRHPMLSAGARRRNWHGAPIAAIAVLLAAVLVSPAAAMTALHLALSVCFLAWVGLRVVALFERAEAGGEVAALRDGDLPVYTIIVPLYREAAVAKDLVAALRRLDYPPEKLDIKLVLEADDFETRTAIDSLALHEPFEIVLAPRLGPRTKPKALAAALLLARGDMVVVYDAEDRPEPDQLRRAVAAFARGGTGLACVQCRLAIDNARDGWLTRHYAGEYAGLFDVLLPMLAGLRLPVPLGGTSNHFRRDALEAVGGWDPYNVTEDADLGIRLARLGYRTALSGSTTWEEAPRRFGPWLRQRTRWFKGWMQTWAVHMRRPGKLLDELGMWGFVVFQLMVGGTVLSALVHPVFLALLVWQAATASSGLPADTASLLVAGLSFATLVSGYGASAALAAAGLARRGLLSIGWVLLTMPVYWLVLSLAAWRALVQLLVDPHRWEKTEHGEAKTSLTGAYR